jgi:hypothetical protein
VLSGQLIRLYAVAVIIIIAGFIFPGTTTLEPVVNPTTQASSLSLQHFPYDV